MKGRRGPVFESHARAAQAATHGRTTCCRRKVARRERASAKGRKLCALHVVNSHQCVSSRERNSADLTGGRRNAVASQRFLLVGFIGGGDRAPPLFILYR